MKAQIYLKKCLLFVGIMLFGLSKAWGEEIKIGLVGGLSGAFSVYAEQTVTGFEMGLEYLTDGTNMIEGKKVVILKRDTQLKPDQGRQVITSLYQDDKVDLVVGGTSSGVTIAMLPVAKQFKKLFIVEPAVAHSITGENWHRYVFRTSRNSDQDAISNAVAIGGKDVAVATLAQDIAFGRDTVAAFEKALTDTGAQLAHAEYVPAKTTNFNSAATRVANALRKVKAKKKYLFVIWAGTGNPLQKLQRLRLDKRYNIELATGGNILAALKLYKPLDGMEGATYYYYKIPKNAYNDWLVAEHQKRFNTPPDFFTAGGASLASAVVTALKKTKGSTDTEALIAAMEGMDFETPKGTMMFRKEDHQALQVMYHFKNRNVDGVDHGVPELVRTLEIADMDIPIRNQN